MIDLQPTPGKLIVEMDPAQETTPGGLVIPGTAIDDGNLGTVVAFCPHSYYDDRDHLMPPIARKGDRVLVGKYSGVKIEYHGRPYVVLGQHEILAIVQPVPVG